MSDTEQSDSEYLSEKEENEENEESSIISNDDSDISENEFDEKDETGEKDENENDNLSEKSDDQNNMEMNSDSDEDGDDDDDSDDEYKNQKFDEDQRTNLIDTYYSEHYSHNYDEVSSLSKVVRDENNNIVDPFHKTNPIMTKYEVARILGARSKQINSGANIFVKTIENVIDGYYIALQELREKKVPFIIRRPIPGGKCEYWNITDLEILEVF